MLKKSILSTILVISLFFSSTIAYGQLDIEAKSVLLIDNNTGEIIYSFDEHKKLPPASITKIMTLLIAMEEIDNSKINLDDEVRISEHASKMLGTTVYLDSGEIQVLENLIKATAIRSANDAAVALAEYISGSESSFVEYMNKRAKELGMENTNFKNASGLPNEDHYTTAFDISLMSKELMKHEKIKEYLNTYMEDIEVGKTKTSIQTMVNTNRLIKDYDGANGVKTGYTGEAKYCISASAKRGDLELIAVLLGSDNSKKRFEDVKRLLDYGFSNYDSLNIGQKNDVLGNVLVEKGKKNFVNIILKDDIDVLLPKGSKENIKQNIITQKKIIAPISKGTKLGELIIEISGKKIKKVDLIAEESIEKAGFLDIFSKTCKTFLINP